LLRKQRKTLGIHFFGRTLYTLCLIPHKVMGDNMQTLQVSSLSAPV